MAVNRCYAMYCPNAAVSGKGYCYEHRAGARCVCGEVFRFRAGNRVAAHETHVVKSPWHRSWAERDYAVRAGLR